MGKGLALITFLVVLFLTGCAPTMSPGTKAIISQDINGLKQALDSGESPDFVIVHKDFQGMSLLELAIDLQNNAAADLLFERGADVTKTAKKEYFDNNANDVRCGGASPRLSFYLDHGLDPNMKFKNGMTPLFATVCDAEETKLLLAKGAKVDQVWSGIHVWGKDLQTPYNATPLGKCIEELASKIEMYASSPTLYWYKKDISRLEENMLLLLTSGANPNALKSERGSTYSVLFYAYKFKAYKAAKALLEHGADVMTISEEERGQIASRTLLHLDVERGKSVNIKNIVEYARSEAKKKASSSKEADRLFYDWLNHADAASYTALHRAAEKGNADLVAVLIKAGADYSLKTSDGLTAQNLYDRKIEADRVALENSRAAARQRSEQSERDARQAEVNRQGLLAIVGAVAIGSATSGSNFSDAQRTDLADAWVQDRVNAANGVESNNFGQEADEVKGQLDMAGMAAASQARVRAEEQRDAKAQPVAQKAPSDTQATTAKSQLSSNGNGNGNGNGAYGATMSSSSTVSNNATNQIQEKIYEYIVDSQYSGVGPTESEGCDAARKGGPGNADVKRIISTGTCSCTVNSNYYGKIYECHIPVKLEISSPFNPNSGYSGPSQGVSK